MIAIIKLMKQERYCLVIAEIPGTVWSVDSCINFLIILWTRNRIFDLIEKFKSLYQKADHSRKENASLVQNLIQNKSRVLTFFKFYILNNIVISVTPLLVTLTSYFTTGVFNPVPLSASILYPFDRVRYYYLVYFAEFISARASMLVT